MRGRTQILVGFGAAAIVASTLTSGPLSRLIWLLGALVCAAPMFAGVLRDGARLPIGWRLVTAGFAVRLAAELLLRRADAEMCRAKRATRDAPAHGERQMSSSS